MKDGKGGPPQSLIRWIVPTALVHHGTAFPRSVGDEDLLPREMAQSFVVGGMAVEVKVEEAERVVEAVADDPAEDLMEDGFDELDYPCDS